MFPVVKWLERLAFAVATVFLVLFGVWQGLAFHSLSLNLFFVTFDLFWIDAFFSVFTFSLFLGVSLIFLIREHLFKEDSLPVGNEGLASVVVPVYKDSNVLRDCVESVLNSSYSELEVLIVCEEDDERSQSVADDLASEFGCVYSLVNEGKSGKAASINYAVEKAEGDILAFFDADQTVHRDFLSDAIGYLSDYEVAQGRRVPVPEGFIESVSYYEKVVFRLSSQLMKFVSFEGVLSSSTVMRRDVFELMDGYRNDRATEDIDFGHRCFREGVSTVRADKYPTYMEAPHSLKDLWGQKKRWVVGQIEILHGNLNMISESNFSHRLLISTAILSMTIFGNLLTLTLIPKFAVLILFGFYSIVLTPFLILSIAAITVRLYDLTVGKLEGIGYTWTLIPFTYGLYGLLMVKSLLEYLLTWNGQWYRVEKGS